MDAPLRIGLSPCLMHEDSLRKHIFNGKALVYAEQSLTHMVFRMGAIPLLLPAWPVEPGVPSVDVLIDQVDALIFAGGVDLSPGSYGESPLRPEWAGDPIRDRFELALFHAAMKLDRPVLGICRGHQLLNVALGGTLYQDISTQIEGSLKHRDPDVYEHNEHGVVFEPGSELGKLYASVENPRVNSVHHQAIHRLGQGLVVEARCPNDGVIEAVRLDGTDRWVRGVQWHPEFTPMGVRGLLGPERIVRELFGAAQARRIQRDSGH